MTDALSQTLEPRCQEILRRTAIALKGRGVGVWEADARGRPRLLAVSSAEDVAPVAADELEALLREVGELPAAGRPPRRWLASRLEGQRWCIAPVRTEPPQPPPAGVERRGPERLTLELAGVCIGLIERQLSEEPMAQFKAMVDSADDAVIGKTLDGVITSWNPAATRLYGYTAEEVIGKPIALLAPPDHIDELPRILERVRRGERIEHHETTRVRKDGARIEVSLSISPILDAQGRPVGATAIAYDVTARQQAEQQLAHGALHDALTDLPNRAYFVERVSQAQARVRRDPDYRFAVLFIDFDNFKAVNDGLGHAAGDRLLTARALPGVRRCDARLGPGPFRHGGRPAERARAPRAAPGVPADRGAPDWSRVRIRGVAALASPQAGRDSAARVCAAGGADRSNHPDRQVGAPGRVPASATLAGRVPDGRPGARQREPVGQTAGAPRPGGRCADGVPGRGTPARMPGARDQRERAHGERGVVDECAASVARAQGRAAHRRLRHGALVAQLAAALPAPCDQDRSLVRAPHG